MTRWLLAIGLLLATVTVARAQPVRVAVVATGGNFEDTVRTDQLAQELAQAIEGTLEVQAIGGLDVRRALPELSKNCVNEPPCHAEVGTKLGVQQILFVVFIDIGGALQVDATWVDLASKQSVTRPGFDIPSVDQAKQRFGENARKLLPDAPVKQAAPAPGTGRMTEPVPRHFTTASKVTLGVAIAGIGAGVALGLVARGRYQDCDDAANPCAQSRQDSIRLLTLGADAGFLVGLGGAIATAVLYATSEEESRLVIEPSPQGATVGARFRF